MLYYEDFWKPSAVWMNKWTLYRVYLSIADLLDEKGYEIVPDWDWSKEDFKDWLDLAYELDGLPLMILIQKDCADLDIWEVDPDENCEADYYLAQILWHTRRKQEK
jgi:hypothetical protein